MDAEIGHVIDGRYRLLRRLGSGGFGQVWAAEDRVLGVQVALKEVRLTGALPEERAELLARAAREARHAAKLRHHPNIVAVHDVVDVSGVPWIVMRLADGHSLADELTRTGPLPESKLLAVARALLQALAAAHEVSIIHRDIKPANVMLTVHGEVLLTDFGIAVGPADTRLTPANLIIGTPGYTAPERWQGAPPSSASDLYSLGVTLYEAAEGELPYPRENPVAALSQQPRSPQRAGCLTPLLSLLLQLDPAARPTAAEALADINKLPDRRTGPPEQHDQTGHAHGAARVSLERKEIVGQIMGHYARWSAFSGLAVGALSLFYVGNGPIFFGIQTGDAGSNRGLAWMLIFVTVSIIGLLIGLNDGMREIADEIVINRDGFSVTRHDLGKKATFTIKWTAVERISVTGPPSMPPHWDKKTEVRVWFRESSQPTANWLAKHRIKQHPDGSYKVYDIHHQPHIPPERLIQPLHRFANALYEDPDQAPDPGTT
ncbi:serine/threonine-protein kinase [Kitasatospora sp. NPDC057936]|uniref:serine/threonine-protein kinase n=1 Tax=Kitasatospora sp. NPDC057936 TaxID=3346283 RepID=UPI0036DE0D29